MRPGKSVISSEPFAPRAVVLLAGGTSDGCSPTLALDTSSTRTAINWVYRMEGGTQGRGFSARRCWWAHCQIHCQVHCRNQAMHLPPIAAAT